MMKHRAARPLTIFIYLCVAGVLLPDASHRANARVAAGQPPLAGTDAIITQTTRKPITLSNLLQNDSDPDGDTLAITELAAGGGGTPTIFNPTTVMWTPARNFTGADTFVYIVSDGHGGTSRGTVNVRNPFQLGAGTYTGAAAGDPAGPPSAGYIVLTVAANGGFTAQVRVGGRTWSARSVFELDGTFQGEMVGPGGRRRLTLQFPIAGNDQPVTGQVTGGQVTSFSLARNRFSSANPAPQAGYFTVKMPPPSDKWSEPHGIGYGTLRISVNGAARLGGKLGDGMAFSSSTYLRADGTLPVYANLYTGRGNIFGTAAFSDDGPVIDVNDEVGERTSVTAGLEWFRPARVERVHYRRGFHVAVTASGANYVVPARNHPVLALDLALDINAAFAANDGGLIRPVTVGAYLGRRPVGGPYDVDFSRVRNPARVALRVNPVTGTFTGAFVDRYRLLRRTFSGVFLQGEDVGVGVFKGGRYTGRVELSVD